MLDKSCYKHFNIDKPTINHFKFPYSYTAPYTVYFLPAAVAHISTPLPTYSVVASGAICTK